MEEEFSLEKYLKESSCYQQRKIEQTENGFETVCNIVKQYFDNEWENSDDNARNKKLEREKAAIIGLDEATGYYKEKIKEILREKNLSSCWFPPWYPSLVEGIFAEIYGLAGLAPWAYDMSDEYKQSSSAKLIGDRMYCLINGVSVLQPQKINEKRRLQLKRALLLATPKERMEYGFHEVYLHNGIRITIYSGDRTKPGEDIMVFRKYVLKNLTFEQIYEFGTIPFDAIELFKIMVKIGFNVIFAGQVRSGKTTFLQTWQKYENIKLEGMAIATDPETPWHIIMPEAPIMQLVADGKNLETITKSLLRGDNDYVLLEEMRDACAYNLALDITSTGTIRSKATIHDINALNIPHKMASKITEKYGGNYNAIVAQVFRNFDFIFEFVQDVEKKNKKILKSITQLSYDVVEDRVVATKICTYDFKNKLWLWFSEINRELNQRFADRIEDLVIFQNKLNELEYKYPLKENCIIEPAYYIRKRGD